MSKLAGNIFIYAFTIMLINFACGSKPDTNVRANDENGILKDDSAARNVNTTGGAPDVTEIKDDPLKK